LVVELVTSRLVWGRYVIIDRLVLWKPKVLSS